LSVEAKRNYWGSQVYEITIELADKRFGTMSGVTLILSFLESVCGYHLEKAKPGWYFFKREMAFE
jgi:hypothetical protein